MAKPETEIRNLKRDLKREHRIASDETIRNRQLMIELTHARNELYDWKKRFDALLKILPKVDGPA